MTSNLGSHLIAEKIACRVRRERDLGRGFEQLKKQLQQLLRQTIRPEFLNRIDEVIVFRPLGPDDLRKIVSVQLRRVSSLLERKGIVLRFDDAARDWLARRGIRARIRRASAQAGHPAACHRRPLRKDPLRRTGRGGSGRDRRRCARALVPEGGRVNARLFPCRGVLYLGEPMIALVVHGGAWDIPDDLVAGHRAGVLAAVNAGWEVALQRRVRAGRRCPGRDHHGGRRDL